MGSWLVSGGKRFMLCGKIERSDAGSEKDPERLFDGSGGGGGPERARTYIIPRHGGHRAAIPILRFWGTNQSSLSVLCQTVVCTPASGHESI